ncbi:MAG: hypothetical protein JWN71_2661 [Xanthobacteraceae bacterium]|nr:hypothetical protein [Xanthobacteraceae bacterium]
MDIGLGGPVFSRGRTMAKISTSIVAGLAFVAAAFAFAAPAQAQFYTATQMAQIESQQGKSRCAQSAEQQTENVKQLASFTARSRQQAETNPLLEADVGYYQAELAFAKTCGRSVSAR